MYIYIYIYIYIYYMYIYILHILLTVIQASMLLRAVNMR